MAKWFEQMQQPGAKHCIPVLPDAYSDKQPCEFSAAGRRKLNIWERGKSWAVSSWLAFMSCWHVVAVCGSLPSTSDLASCNGATLPPWRFSVSRRRFSCLMLLASTCLLYLLKDEIMRRRKLYPAMAIQVATREDSLAGATSSWSLEEACASCTTTNLDV